MADQPRRHLLVSTHLNGNAMKRALPCFPAGVWGFAARSLCFSQTPDAMALETLYLAFDTWHGVTQIWPLGGLFRGVRSLPCHSGCTNRCGSSLASMHSDVEVLSRCLPISTRHQRANLTGMRRSWRCDVSRIESRAWEVSSNRPFSTPPISVTLLTADVIHGFWFSDVPQTISCYWYPQLFRMKRVTGDKVRRQEPWLRYNVEGLTVGVSGLCVAEEMIGRL